MDIVNLFAAFTLTFGVANAHAQGLSVQPQAEATTAGDTATGARPGHVPGVGQSLPLSDKASNIATGDTHSVIAPTLPMASIGVDAAPRAYLQEARDDLTGTGRTGQAQEALEMAETRSLDRIIPPSQDIGVSQNEMVGQIAAARMALGKGDIPQTISLIDLALKN